MLMPQSEWVASASDSAFSGSWNPTCRRGILRHEVPRDDDMTPVKMSDEDTPFFGV
jgi:hypothetical protein